MILVCVLFKGIEKLAIRVAEVLLAFLNKQITLLERYEYYTCVHKLDEASKTTEACFVKYGFEISFLELLWSFSGLLSST